MREQSRFLRNLTHWRNEKVDDVAEINERKIEDIFLKICEKRGPTFRILELMTFFSRQKLIGVEKCP